MKSCAVNDTFAANVNSAATNPRVSVITYQDSEHRLEVVALWKEASGPIARHNQAGIIIDKKLAVDDLFFAAITEGRVVGTVMAGYDGHRGWIYSVAVALSHRRRGIGSMLVSHAEQVLTKRGCLKINLPIAEGNESVEAFYAKLGYKTEKRISMGKLIEANLPPQ